jgi:hypothetical protein
VAGVEGKIKPFIIVMTYVSPNTAHEFQTWRRSLHELAPLLFRN